MKNFGKLKIIAVMMSVIFSCTSTLYPCPIERDSLRVSIGETSTYERIYDVIRTDEEHQIKIDTNLQYAHENKKVRPFKEGYSREIDLVHNFLRENGFDDKDIAVFTALQKDGLWLVEPMRGRPLPLEHASDRGIHILDSRGEDLARSYAHGIAAYIGLPHHMSDSFEKAFAEWRKKGNLLDENLKRNFTEMLQERKNDPLLLTHLSEKEKEGIYQRDYTRGDGSSVKAFILTVGLFVGLYILLNNPQSTENGGGGGGNMTQIERSEQTKMWGSEQYRQRLDAILNDFDRLGITIRDDNNTSPRWVLNNYIAMTYEHDRFGNDIDPHLRITKSSLGGYRAVIYMGDMERADPRVYREKLLHELRHAFHFFRFGLRIDTRVAELEEEIRNIEQDLKVYDKLGFSQQEKQWREADVRALRRELNTWKAQARDRSTGNKLRFAKKNQTQV